MEALEPMESKAMNINLTPEQERIVKDELEKTTSVRWRKLLPRLSRFSVKKGGSQVLEAPTARSARPCAKCSLSLRRIACAWMVSPSRT